MSAIRAGALVMLALATAPGCQPAETLDHYWSHAHCTATIRTPDGQEHASGAAAYLRRENGSSDLVIQLDDLSIGINDPYPSGPLIRFGVPPGVRAPATLKLVHDTSDVRGPLIVAPGEAWLATLPRVDTTKPGDDWRFGTGNMAVSALAIHENDTSSRDSVSFDGTFDLTGVQASGLAPGALPEAVAGAVRVKCADDLAATDGGLDLDAELPDGGPDAANDSPGDDAAGDASACGQSGSCANPACGDCNGNPGDFCETSLRSVDHCGACTRSCGAGGTCDPLGACVGTSLASDAATAVAVDTTGVGFLVAATAGKVRFAPSGGAPADVGPGGQISAHDSIQLDGSELWFASYAGISHATVPGGAPTGAYGAVQPDSIRLIGLDASYAYVVTVSEGSAPPRDVVRRISRATGALDIVACMLSGMIDATVDRATGAVFVSNGTSVTRYVGTQPGSTCSSTTIGTMVASAQSGEGIARVAAGTTRLVWIAAAGNTGTVHSADLLGAEVPITLGQAASTSGLGASWPLAVAGDTALWVDATPIATSPNRWRIVAGDGSATPTSLAVTGNGVACLAADATAVVWGEGAGVFRVAR